MNAYVILSAICMTMAVAISPTVIAATEVTLVGEVNDNFQLYADGKIYEVADTPAGNDMVTNYISEKVEVVGSVEVIGEDLILTVRSFKVVPD
jgi:hypothetical protein